MVPKTGQGVKSKNPGMKSKNSYKLTSDGMFGNLWIDQEELNDLKLETPKDDKKVLSRKADRDLIDLLTKRYNTKKQYSQQSLDTFAKPIDLSGLPNNACSLKNAAAKKTGGSWPGSNIQGYKSPDELVERLHLLIGPKQDEKVSVNIDSEIVTIHDRRYQDGIIKKKDDQKLHTAYV